MKSSQLRVGVIGGGTMGTGIAICAVRAHIPTILHEVDEATAAAAEERIAAFLNRSVEKGKLSGQLRDQALKSLTTTTDLSALVDCSVLVEAIFEDLGAKQGLFSQLDEVCSDDAMFATNTSTLPVSEIAAGSRRPERVVGTHFCNPAPFMLLVEVVRGLLTDDATYEKAMRFTDAVGKTGVGVPDTPGFLVNRFLVPFENDCIRAVERKVATVKDIDRGITLGLGYPMGPFSLLDTVGLDVHRAVSLSLYRQLRDPRFAPPSLVDRMIASGHLGRKTGQGFYTYRTPGMFGT